VFTERGDDGRVISKHPRSPRAISS
jgi:hypothetical protein